MARPPTFGDDYFCRSRLLLKHERNLLADDFGSHGADRLQFMEVLAPNDRVLKRFEPGLTPQFLGKFVCRRRIQDEDAIPDRPCERPLNSHDRVWTAEARGDDIGRQPVAPCKLGNLVHESFGAGLGWRRRGCSPLRFVSHCVSLL
jgi:hypothetical protein